MRTPNLTPMSLDGLTRKIAGLGIPGLVLLIAVSATGYTGAAAVTTALSALGPFGMIGGIGTLALTGLISAGITRYGVEKIFESVMNQLVDQGHTRAEIIRQIESYPISEGLKLKLKERVNGYFDED
ncbi:hypothetical protein GGP91_003360 [Salinibacter ruber]|uniref:hypothetical protein n=2 Tax=Salinibacter ruber TaxID=146919 RepID=UPI002167CED9|nr:hypothetical protein [Salinibacter ruber]MCS3655171.1 hypothetical protein [Salinibacter ruber]MCS3831259.1 hypothetical protein [Salinibacter ruber]MCS4057904.1 hypothetical protein [Salinibacter ruber]